MADPKKEGFVARTVQQAARRHMFKSVEQQMQQLNVGLEHFKDDIEKVEKVSKRAAAKLVKQAQALGIVDDKLVAIKSRYQQIDKEVRVADQKVSLWGKRFAGLKQVIQHHAAEITAAAGAGLAFKNALEQYNTATTQLVQTTGQIGDNALDAAKRADDLADAYRISVAGMGKFGVAADQAKAAAAELVKLYGGKAVKGTPDFAEAMETIGSMARATGKSTEEITGLYRKRYLEQGRTMKQTNLELAHVVHSYEQVRESSEKLQKAGQNVSIMFKDDFAKAVDETANEISPLTADLDKTAKIVGAAAKSASQLGLKLADINKISSQIGKAFKLPATVQFEVGKELLTEVMTERSKSTAEEFDKYLKSNFKGNEQLVRKLLDEFEKKSPDGLSEWNLAQSLMQMGAGQGLVMSKQLKKLQEFARNKEFFVNYMRDVFGGDTKLALIAQDILVKGGTMEDVTKQMEKEAKAAGGKDKDANERAEKAAKVAKGTMEKQHKAAKTWLDEWKSWLLSQFQSPIRSILITMGGLGAWALVNVVSNRIIAGQVAGVARAAEAAAAASGMAAGTGAAAAGAGGATGRVGSWFSSHPKMGAALAVGATVAIGGYELSHLSTTDPEKMKKDLEKTAGLSPGDLETYSSPDKINAKLANDALKAEEKTGAPPAPGAGSGAVEEAAAAQKAATEDVLSGKQGVTRAVKARDNIERKRREQGEVEFAGSGVLGLITMGGLGAYAAQAGHSIKGWARKKDLMPGQAAVKKTLPDMPEGYSDAQIEGVRDLINRHLRFTLGGVEYKQRLREMEAQNAELKLRQYDTMLEGLSRAGSKSDYLKSKEAEQQLAVIRRLGGEEEAERIRALAAEGKLGEHATQTREAVSRAFGVKAVAALGTQEQQQQQKTAGQETMVGPDGRPLTDLSQAMLRMRFQANYFDKATGALVCDWTNPEMVSTIFQTVRLHAQGGKRAKRG